MTWAGWKWPTLALIAAAGVGAFAIYTLGRHNSDAGSDGKPEIEQADAIGRVRLHAKRTCEAPWWEDDYCIRRVKATRFTAKDGGEGFWLVREHVRGDQPFQDACWLVEPDTPSRRITGGWWFNTGLRPLACGCPAFRARSDRRRRHLRTAPGHDPELARVLSVLCPGSDRSSAQETHDRQQSRS
jgi:hypothetical protein